ncbi:tRNA 2-selenouridine(34) synthase MnmH [Tunicatimonas pelagia]|uniref:tRNA 2-selenouridine(34) synthase MnmH n=1 Tax=Tunicatimonas pelagia TaxID=931531 RepID=UPI00266631D7|nr:tRNA 2-selenouridine(34) synthase MnmH [Tunicatimonas pelagia]WKN45113.1 tRNA 2-selenouridine(34) synthase MnmH [Tunicatimonas pelagia]
MASLSVHEFLNRGEQLPILDVRSPAEYEAGHIYKAHNLPLFSNEERAQVGTAYKQISRYEALLQGLDIVGPKMRNLVETASELAVDGQVLVHCWRGGMRSESVAWLLTTAGLQAHTLADGYKAYRRAVLEIYQNPLPILIVGGTTGSGKTEILQELAEQGEQIIDLEKLANHRGSAFGGIGQSSQPTSEQFQNSLFAAWRSLDLSRTIWVEDESFSIGGAQLPHEFWEHMKQAPVVVVEVPRSLRVQRLVRDYGHLDPTKLARAIHTIERRLGGLRTQQALQALEEKRLADVADLLLEYYDRSYQRNLNRKTESLRYTLDCPTDDPATNAQLIRKFAANKNLHPNLTSI